MKASVHLVSPRTVIVIQDMTTLGIMPSAGRRGGNRQSLTSEFAALVGFRREIVISAVIRVHDLASEFGDNELQKRTNDGFHKSLFQQAFPT